MVSNKTKLKLLSYHRIDVASSILYSHERAGGGAFYKMFGNIYIVLIWLILVKQVSGVQKSLSEIDFDLGQLQNLVSGLVSFLL